MRFGILLLARSARRTRRVQCLPWDREVGLRWAELLATLRAAGLAMPIKDSQIAATAITHGLTVVSHNRPDFEKAGVPVLDPFPPPLQIAPTTRPSP